MDDEPRPIPPPPPIPVDYHARSSRPGVSFYLDEPKARIHFQHHPPKVAALNHLTTAATIDVEAGKIGDASGFKGGRQKLPVNTMTAGRAPGKNIEGERVR